MRAWLFIVIICCVAVTRGANKPTPPLKFADTDWDKFRWAKYLDLDGVKAACSGGILYQVANTYLSCFLPDKGVPLFVVSDIDIKNTGGREKDVEWLSQVVEETGAKITVYGDTFLPIGGDGYDRGHLSPNGDYEDFQRKANTFTVVNRAPQDLYFNRNHWKCIEMAVRKLQADEMPVDPFVVVTWLEFAGDTKAMYSGSGHTDKGATVPYSFNKAVFATDASTKTLVDVVCVNHENNHATTDKNTVTVTMPKIKDCPTFISQLPDGNIMVTPTKLPNKLKSLIFVDPNDETTIKWTTRTGVYKGILMLDFGEETLFRPLTTIACDNNDVMVYGQFSDDDRTLQQFDGDKLLTLAEIKQNHNTMKRFAEKARKCWAELRGFFVLKCNPRGVESLKLKLPPTPAKMDIANPRHTTPANSSNFKPSAPPSTPEHSGRDVKGQPKLFTCFAGNSLKFKLEDSKSFTSTCLHYFNMLDKANNKNNNKNKTVRRYFQLQYKCAASGTFPKDVETYLNKVAKRKAAKKANKN